MKRISLIIIFVLGVLLTVAVVLWRSSSQKTIKENSAEAPVTSDIASETNSQPGEQNQQLTSKYVDTNSPEFQKLIAVVHAQSEKNITERNKPIGFYGKVVDEETQAVAGVSVHFIWVDPKSTSASDTTSAADGSFSLTDVVGGNVSVYVSKTGYYEIKSLDTITFDNTGNGSSRENPVLFHLRKQGTGTDLITSKSGFSPDFRISAPLDGTPVRIDFLGRKVDTDGSLEISQIKPEYLQARQATNWSFKMNIPDGGLVEENDEFPFEAPESGYQPVIEFDFQQGQPNWTTDIQKDYYIKFGNPPLYGHLHLETTIGMDGARLTYAINPTGSRNLEPKN